MDPLELEGSPYKGALIKPIPKGPKLVTVIMA